MPGNIQNSIYRFNQFIVYLLLAKHRKGFGVHSPFAFGIIHKVLRVKKNNELSEIRKWRKAISSTKRNLKRSTFGAGSSVKSEVSIGQLIKNISLPHKYGALLFAIVRYFKPTTIVELGTCCGVSAAYLSKASPDAKIYTCEGDTGLVKLAERNLRQLSVKNVIFHNTNFSDFLNSDQVRAAKIDLAFIDGDHSCNATISNFEKILLNSHNDTVLIIDDIYWSAGMTKAWREIKIHEKVRVTMDFYRLGLVFLKKELQKQHYRVRF